MAETIGFKMFKISYSYLTSVTTDIFLQENTYFSENSSYVRFRFDITPWNSNLIIGQNMIKVKATYIYGIKID